MTYNPLTGENYTIDEARSAWGSSMGRSKPAWQLRGNPGEWYWSYFNFLPFRGRVTVEADGFHWQTASYDEPDIILHSGVTTSVYEAYQSVVQNKSVVRDEP